MTLWLLNSAVIPAGGYGTYRYRSAKQAELREFVRRNPVSRIGYAETAEAIHRWTGVLPAPSREASALEPGDVAMVVRLRYRVDPQRKGAPTGASDDDWEIGVLERLADATQPAAATQPAKRSARGDCPWYISAHAVRRYCVLRGWDGGDEDSFARAEDELFEIASQLATKQPALQGNGLLRYRAGRPTRWQYLVSTADRAEGELPQLVDVRPSSERG